jgi:hypothetical protein
MSTNIQEDDLTVYLNIKLIHAKLFKFYIFSVEKMTSGQYVMHYI